MSSLTWSTATRHGSNSLAHQFPSFQIDASQAAKGNVRVEAQSPSGNVLEMSVTETGGVYTTNFTPTEVGDWLISILYEGQHIQGSPFNVRVYDAAQVKVFGLEGGAVGQPFSFSADCSQAGDGDLTVDITHNGRQVTSSITPDYSTPGTFRVNFTPGGSGIYTIQVYFAGMEVTLSPYTLEIVDSSMVTASGDGLSNLEVNKNASFIIRTNGAPDGDVQVNITGPHGRMIPIQVVNQGDGTFKVDYVANDVGDYMVDVFYFGKHIQGSPFRVQAINRNLITMKNLKSSCGVGKTVDFDIDAQHAGSGNLEIMVNDGTIPCSVQNRGNRQFHATFTPKEPIPHYIQMKFNGIEVPGSPWRVDVRGATSVTASGQGLQIVPIRQMTSIEVRVGGNYFDGNLEVKILSPTQQVITPRIINNHNGSYRIEYVPTDVGNYLIDMLYDGSPVQGSPFTSKAYDTSAITVSPVNNGVAGKNVEFTIDLTQAGEGQLEIMVNRGSVPNTVRMLSKGIFNVSFVPREPQPHLIDIKFNGELLPTCPIRVPIMDASRVTVQGDGLHQVAVNRFSSFRVNTASAGNADLKVRVTSPNGDSVPARIVLQPDGDYKVEYSSKYTGRHTVEILYAGQAIMGSPFYVEIYDPNKIRVDGMKSGSVGESIGFNIIRHEAGKAELSLNIVSPSGKNVPFDIIPTGQGERVAYTPYESGPHHIYITYGGLEVPGCPMTQTIGDSAHITAFGDGLYKGMEDQPTRFFVNTQGHRGDLSVQVEGPNSISKCTIESDADNHQIVTYTPVESGTFKIVILWNGREIQGSPFRSNIVPETKMNISQMNSHVNSHQSSDVSVDGGWGAPMELYVNEMKTIRFYCGSSGAFNVEVRSPGGMLPVDIQPHPQNSYAVSFTPRNEGEHTLAVRYADMTLPQTLRGMARQLINTSVNHDKVILTGRGLQTAQMREEAEFVIDGTNAGSGTPQVKLVGVNDDISVSIMNLGSNKYKCTYIPSHEGAYLLHITWSDRHVRGSPFKVDISVPSEPSKVVCTGEGLKIGVMGTEIKSVIDTRRAGPGELTAHCTGPSKVAYCELYDHHNGTFTLNIQPQEAGKHTLQVKYADQHVPGSPFNLRVSGAPDASKVRVYGPGVEHGLLATYQSRFIVETRGAGAGQLTVRIRGPRGAFRVEMQRDSQKDRTILCRYDPTEVGDYVLHIKWSGEHVPNSPFHVQIFDTESQMQKFQRDNNTSFQPPVTNKNATAGQGEWDF